MTEDAEKYLKDPEAREEGGTPAIVESIRAGMAMQLKQAVGSRYIMTREAELMKKARDKLSGVDNLLVLGDGLARPDIHLPIVSFVVKSPTGNFLHHNFVCAVLNDVFGIQARGGCACAGPYAQRLLGLSRELSREYESMLLEDERLDRKHLRRGHAEYSSYEILRPGFSRLNLPWFSTDEEIDFVLDAVVFVARQGWKLMPQYIFNNETGEWRHASNLVFQDRRWLGHVSYESGEFFNRPFVEDVEVDLSLKDVMAKAKELADNAEKAANRLKVPDQRILFHGRTADLRWMMLPIEAKEELLKKPSLRNGKSPFTPPTNGRERADAEASTGSLRPMENLLTESRLLKRKLAPSFEKEPSKKFLKDESSEKVDSEVEPSRSSCEDGSCALIDGKRPEASPLQIKSKWHSPPSKDIFQAFHRGR